MIGIVSPPQPIPPAAARDKPRDYLSYSAITTYQSCPQKYCFRYLEVLPEKTVSANLVFGSAVHRAVEHHFMELMVGNEPPSNESLVGAYDAAWNEYDPAAVRFGKDEDRDKLQSLAQRVLAAFQSSALATPAGAILGVEEELRGPLVPGAPDLLGRIDLITETSDAVIVTDLKTARSRWSSQQLEEAAGQLHLYHELVRGFSPHKPIRLQFAVVTKAKQLAIDLHEVPADSRRVERTKRIVERVWRAIEAGAFFPTPSPMACGGCPFRAPCRAWGG